jgi:transcriptional regulator with XRE-family HTH domain
MRLANRVRELRYKKGWGPDDLAARAKVSRTALYHLESGRTGRPQAGTLRRIARALEVSPEELLRECDGAPETDPNLSAEPAPLASGQTRRPKLVTGPGAPAWVTDAQSAPDPVVSMALHRLGRMLGLPPQSLDREEALLAELVRPSPVTPPAAARSVSNGPSSATSPEMARLLIEKFVILLSSPMAKGIAQIVEESFRLLPILPAISGTDDRLYGYSSQVPDQDSKQTDSGAHPHPTRRAN